MKCFYHGSDLDGKCSAAIVKYNYPDCYMIPMDHGKKFDWSRIPRDEIVYMVDFTIEPFKDMFKLPVNLVWIDHHVDKIKESFNCDFSPLGIRDNSKAACELTWEWCNPNTEIPLGVKLLGRYDVWDLNWKSEDNIITSDNVPIVIAFQYGIKLIDTSSYSFIWDSIFNNDIELIKKIIEKGKYAYKYAERYNESYVKSYSFETIFEDCQCICCNKALCNSSLFESIWEDSKYDIAIAFCRTKNSKWKVSLYTKKEGIDCSVIAKKYGGGGHTKAAGFRCKNLPFTI